MEGAFSIDSGLTIGTKLITWVMDTVSGNEVLAAVLVVGLLVPAGIAGFTKLIHSVK